MREVSLTRLYVLRALYLFIVVGLGIYVWPEVIRSGSHWGPSEGMATCMIASFSILCLVGLRYPVMILPVLIWEIVWKTLWLVTVPLPQWLHGHVDEGIRPAVFGCSMVLLVYIAVPWRYVFDRFVMQTADRWR